VKEVFSAFSNIVCGGALDMFYFCLTLTQGPANANTPIEVQILTALYFLALANRLKTVNDSSRPDIDRPDIDREMLARLSGPSFFSGRQSTQSTVPDPSCVEPVPNLGNSMDAQMLTRLSGGGL
jgi:hypothetical protein